jgi:Planctomycete cytochrome C
MIANRTPSLLFLAIAPAFLSPARLPAAQAPDFQREIRPILSNICFKCHGPDQDERKGGKEGSGGLRLDTEEGARADLDGAYAVVPGHPEKSELMARIVSDDPDEVMPPPKSGKKLSAREVELLKQWIAAGAKYAKHWSYENPVRPAPPSIADCGLRTGPRVCGPMIGARIRWMPSSFSEW